ncbi:MAG TPA: GAF domain-containing sensor histidine kinase, partial [Gemmatimonadaceae bacterium]|nr:GAF domain-containing sensor histidine kinase [Gemmatimonadaceae bacterium]
MNDAPEPPLRRRRPADEVPSQGASSGARIPRVERRKPERRALFLAEISRNLLESLDYEETLAKVARLAMPELGAWCIVDLIRDDMAMERLAVFHPDPALEPLTRELAHGYPPKPGDIFGAPRIVDTQQPELISEVTPELLDSAGFDRKERGILETLGFCSYMVVPLKARGRLIGAMTFVAATSDQRYTPTDLLFAEDLAGRAAMAMDNARLYREAEIARMEAVDAVERAEIADRAKTDFLATMSHELRTPLNAIAGYAELLELGMRGPISEQQLEAIRRIRRSEQHLLGIVNDILMFAKTETGRIPLTLEDTSVATVLESVRFLIHPMLVANDVRLVQEGCEKHLAVVADYDRLNQILLNLLSNAVKFSRRGGEVRLACEVVEHLVAIHVEDEGHGIAEDKLEDIFEP